MDPNGTPTMDNAFAVFTTLQTVALGLTAYVLTAILRRVLETGNPHLLANRWWRNVLLPLAPVANAILLAVFLRDFPWPEAVATSVSTRIMYALVCGIVCGWVYSRVRKFIRDPQGQELGGMNPMGGVPMGSPEPSGQGDFLNEPENGIFEAPEPLVSQDPVPETIEEPEPPRPRKRKRKRKPAPVEESEAPKPRKRKRKSKPKPTPECDDPSCPHDPEK